MAFKRAATLTERQSGSGGWGHQGPLQSVDLLPEASAPANNTFVAKQQYGELLAIVAHVDFDPSAAGETFNYDVLDGTQLDKYRVVGGHWIPTQTINAGDTFALSKVPAGASAVAIVTAATATTTVNAVTRFATINANTSQDIIAPGDKLRITIDSAASTTRRSVMAVIFLVQSRG